MSALNFAEELELAHHCSAESAAAHAPIAAPPALQRASLSHSSSSPPNTSAGLSSFRSDASGAARILTACGFADARTCAFLVAHSDRQLSAAAATSSSSNNNNTVASSQAWSLSRLYSCARQCKAVRDSNDEPPLLFGVPGAYR